MKSLCRQFCRLTKDDTSKWTPTGRHNKRVKNLILFGGFITVFLSAGWGAYYLSEGTFLLALISLLSATTGIVIVVLGVANHLRSAAIIMSHVLLLTIVLSSLSDVPIDNIPPSIHMNLLPVCAATFLIFHREGIYLRLLLPVMGLLLFLALELNIVPLSWSYLVAPVDGRSVGVWMNNITGVVGISIVIVMMQSDMKARSTLESDMRLAIARGEYHFHYQPQVDIAGRILGVEALLRWNHPTRGNIPPLEFIPLAEETGLIIPMGAWGLRTACAQLAEWEQSELTSHLTVSVNVSATQFRQPDFVQEVKTILLLSGATPSKLKLELTETALADDMDVVIKKMNALKDIGVTWSLDDFGTGFSSLNLLKRLPLDQLKIDKSFVSDLLSDKRSLSIVNTILHLSQNLNLMVIAEGVENEKQLAALQLIGCQFYQGFLFSHPLPISELNDLIEGRVATGYIRRHPESV
ncbi:MULTISPECIES: putative bifunctional diguanylate cyclase/phosphodiesterase [Marinomonas]|uniref:EAL domain-containing protein n=1 Tax=Marinomonas rhodophyticola TaxID=2992803 RepID=A0ABT3KL35_9GAMM|nr:EAL domain-containing protein [Marinomonas sp. KJ51-3]MCW4631114.1 EAL domain-containing protein [Marinomonas sp. KJ51-3]